MDRTGHEQDWSEEFQILYEYDPIVTQCHDQLRSLGDELAERFRNEVVGDRSKAKEVTARIVAEHGAALRRYARGSLNEALKDVRQLGKAAEREFVRVVDVLGEDLDVGAVVTRIEEKFGGSKPAHRVFRGMEITIGLGGSAHYLADDGTVRTFTSFELATEDIRQHT